MHALIFWGLILGAFCASEETAASDVTSTDHANAGCPIKFQDFEADEALSLLQVTQAEVPTAAGQKGSLLQKGNSQGAHVKGTGSHSGLGSQSGLGAHIVSGQGLVGTRRSWTGSHIASGHRLANTQRVLGQGLGSHRILRRQPAGYSSRIPNKLLLSYRQQILPSQTGASLLEFQKNLNRTLSSHPGMVAIFSDDEDCHTMLARVHSQALARDFQDKSTEMFKSDICRLAMLYDQGGYAFDNDIEVIKDVRYVIPPDASISTVLALPRANPPNTIFNGFIAAVARHPAIMDAMDGTWAFYRGKKHLSHKGFDWRDHRMIVSEALGNSLLKWLDIDRLNVQRQYRHPNTLQGSHPSEFAYFFSETEDVGDKYHLQRRNGIGESCHVAVVDGAQAIAWSRFVGSEQSCRKSGAPAMLQDTAGQSQSRIPNKILFNFKQHILTQQAGNQYAELKANIKKIMAHHPGMQVIFYDNLQCAQAIKRVHSAALANHFNKETTGMFKSDICRLAMLYEHGGYYFDNDLEVLQDVRKSLPPGVSFSSVLALPRCNRPNALFQAFAAVAPKHPVIMNALNGTLQWYETKEYTDLNGVPDGYKRLMGTEVLGKSVMRWMGVEKLQAGLLQEHARPRANLVQKDWPGNLEFAYFFEEAEGDLDKFGLKPRRGTGGSCNIFVKNGDQPVAWSRFVGSGVWCDHERRFLGFR